MASIVERHELSDAITPAIKEALRHSGLGVKRACAVWNPLDDDLDLVVTHRLLSRHELDQFSIPHQAYQKLMPRLCEAMLIKDFVFPSPRIERRRMMMRAKSARELKAKPKNGDR